MLTFIKILEKFILPLLFSKDEYNFKSNKFNPLRLIIIVILVANMFFTGYILNKLAKIYDLIQKECPAVIKDT